MNAITMTRLTTLAGAVALVFSSGAWAADDTATQTFHYEVQEIALISVSGNPEAMVITTATEGSAPTAVQNALTTYSLTNNAGADSKMVTAAIDTNTPSGVTLEVTLADPGGATSTKQSLSTTATRVLESIDNVNVTSKTITYDLSATAAAGKVAPTAVTVTFTITDQGV